MNDDSSEVKSVYRLYEENTHHLLTDRVTFIFLDLSKFSKTIKELDGNILEGMYFCFKNMASLEDRPAALRHEVFTKIFAVTELYNMDQQTRDKVLDKMTTERDLRNQMAWAKQEAIEEGRAEGRAEGQQSKAVEIAIKLIATGMPKAEAAAFVGISEEDLAEVE